MNYIYKAFAALSVGLAVFACKKDEYVPAELEPVQTYVGADITAPRNIDADGSAIEIPFTRNKVAEALDITPSKASVLLNKMVAAGIVEKGDVKGEKGKRKAYTLA